MWYGKFELDITFFKVKVELAAEPTGGCEAVPCLIVNRGVSFRWIREEDKRGSLQIPTSNTARPVYFSTIAY